jgi:hypothetical protein
MAHTCLVCSYPKLKSPPHSPSGGGSYEICPSCGYQYGVDDDDRGITPEEWRRTWIANGAHWSSQGIQAPTDWKFGDLPTQPTLAKKAAPKRATTAAPAKSLPPVKTKLALATKTTTAKKAAKKAPTKKKSR